MVKDQPSNEHKQFHDGREKKNDKTIHADANRELFVTKGCERARTHAHIRFGGSASSEMYS